MRQWHVVTGESAPALYSQSHVKYAIGDAAQRRQ